MKFALLGILFLGSVTTYAQEQVPLPDGCGNPFVQPGIFGDFFDKTIRTALIEAGNVSQPHVQLFAVNAIRKHIAEKFPNPQSGDVIDKHIRAQICSYAEGKENITSASVELHRHLASISAKLLRDSKKIATELQQEEKERQRLIAKFESRQGLIDRAEKMGRQEAHSVLTKY